jgi:hypothetical protein
MRKIDCECRQLPRIFNVEKYSNHLKDRFEVVDRTDDNWIELGKCRVCGQYWQIDKWDKYQTICAIRVDFPDNWQNYDDKADRMQLLFDSRSGLSQEKCIKAGCENKALKSLAYCLNHAWEIGLRE